MLLLIPALDLPFCELCPTLGLRLVLIGTMVVDPTNQGILDLSGRPKIQGLLNETSSRVIPLIFYYFNLINIIRSH